MIEIDLLPVQFREKRQFDFSQIRQVRRALIVFICVLLLHLLFYGLTLVSAKKISALKKNRAELSFKETRIEQIKSELVQIERKLPLIKKLIRDRVLWSKKLQRISELLVAGVWLSELKLERGSLLIRGSAASPLKDEPALIGRFMQNLKDDAYFSADFSGIELGPIKKRQIAQADVMDFILTCRFKQQ